MIECRETRRFAAATRRSQDIRKQVSESKATREEVKMCIMRYAVSLGADPAPWRISHFVRTPDGFRPDTGREQTVLFYDDHSQ